jgi:ABC-type multidrug transport system ATPase subunit
VIRIHQLTKRFGRLPALDHVSLTIAPGESVALWGGNGAGKTTLIRCVLGLLDYQGRIEVAGFDARRRGKHARALIGHVPQELTFYDDLRADAAVRFFARLKGLPVADPADVLAGVGLAGHESQRVRELSGGMKQRLALAVALLGDPPVLILDEVTASLDAAGRRDFVALLARLATNGRCMLFASHRVEELAALATRVVTLDRGRLAADQPVADFLAGGGQEVTLHLHIRRDLRADAADLLRTRGYAPRMNGVGLLVPVPSPRKALPLRILTEERIAVDDFEVLSGGHEPPHHPETRP